MPHHLMNLRHVPDDEAEEIRALFEDHGVRYYETPPSRWGISMGGFWVHDAEEAERAKALLDENPKPTEAEVKAALRGNLCRCTGYDKIVKAVLAAAKKMAS